MAEKNDENRGPVSPEQQPTAKLFEPIFELPFKLRKILSNHINLKSN